MHRIESNNTTVDTNGNSIFTNGPPGTAMNAEWCNAVQEEIANVIEGNGASLQSKAGDTRNQLFSAINSIVQMYDTVISTQAQFNAIVERTGANAYKFKDAYRSVYFKYVTGGYAVAGASSILSGGDTWMQLSTNNLADMKFAPGAYLNCADTPFSVNANTSVSVLQNVIIQGDGSVAAAVVDGFILANTYVKFINCGVKNRLSNTTMNGFRGSVTALHNITSSYEGCYVDGLTSSGTVRGYYLCHNLSNYLAYDLESTAGACYGAYQCDKMNTGTIYTLDGTTVYGIDDSDNISILRVYDLDATGASNGISNCSLVSSVIAESVTSSGGFATGFHTITNISSCYANNITCASGGAGFYNCDYMAAVESGNIVNGDGFQNCTYGAALYTAEAVNSGNDFIDTTDAQITNKVSCPAVFT